jgi:hypothetical protein
MLYLLFFSRIFLLGILIFKRLTARQLYKSFGVKGLIFTFSNSANAIENFNVP